MHVRMFEAAIQILLFDMYCGYIEAIWHIDSDQSDQVIVIDKVGFFNTLWCQQSCSKIIFSSILVLYHEQHR